MTPLCSMYGMFANIWRKKHFHHWNSGKFGIDEGANSTGSRQKVLFLRKGLLHFCRWLRISCLETPLEVPNSWGKNTLWGSKTHPKTSEFLLKISFMPGFSPPPKMGAFRLSRRHRQAYFPWEASEARSDNDRGDHRIFSTCFTSWGKGSWYSHYFFTRPTGRHPQVVGPHFWKNQQY